MIGCLAVNGLVWPRFEIFNIHFVLWNPLDLSKMSKLKTFQLPHGIWGGFKDLKPSTHEIAYHLLYLYQFYDFGSVECVFVLLTCH